MAKVHEYIIKTASNYLNKAYKTDLNIAPAFKPMLEAVGAQRGADVSAAFVYHVLSEAHRLVKLDNPIAPSAYAYGLWLSCFTDSYKVTNAHYATKKRIATLDFSKIECDATTLRPGDIFLIKLENGMYQTGIISTIKSYGLCTIEVSASAIVSKRRNFNQLDKCIRIC